MEEFSKNGRKLRPRRTSGASEHHAPAFSSSNYHRENTEGRSERPHRSYGDRPQRSFGERSERPQRSYGERPQRSFGDRAQRSYSDRPQRNFGDRPARPYGEHSDRPRRSFGEGSERPARNYGDRPQRNYGDRPAFGGRQGRPARKPFGKPQRTWSQASDEGMERMLSRKPVVNGAELSDADVVKTPIREEVRLNKFIANSGVCSRREADTLIQAGVVTVNGEVVTELGVKVNILKDDIRFNGEKLKGEEKVYIVMNKPKGYVTTAADPHADKTVMELLKGCPYRVFPVGRLDKATTGVLMFTNDGEIAERLTHPSYDKKKIYQVLLDKPLSDEDYNAILSGITLSDGDVKADELEFIEANDHRKLGIEIHSGKNRIVRRIFEHCGYEVKALDRVYFAGLTKKGLKKGEWRQLTEGEVNILKMGAYV